MANKQNRQTETTMITLSMWLIQNTNGESYRAGRLSGWKRPKVNSKLIASVGGMQQLLQQAKLLEQDALLGRAGKIKFDWRDMYSDIRKIEYDISIIPELCKREGMVDPREYQQEMIARVEQWREQAKTCEWLLSYCEDLLASLQSGKKKSDAENELLFECLSAIAKQTKFVWERVFSANVFNDSKQFKTNYKGHVLTILKNHSPYYVEGMSDDELLAMHNIHSYAQTLEWKGPLQYKIDGKILVDTAKNRYGTVINSQTMEHSIPSVLPQCKKIMTIENKANYENMTYADDTLYIFCHGYFSPKEVKFLSGLRDIVTPECEFYHWGDMDFGGISIFLFIKEKLFDKLIPYKMDAEHFRKAIKAGAGIELEPSTKEKLQRKDAGVLSELKEIILETNMTIEQERLL